MKRTVFLTAIMALPLFLSCQESVQETPSIPIRIATSVTRATDTAFETKDAVGLFVVNQPAALAQSGNHVDNVKFSYDGDKWAAVSQLYWYDDKTKADFYAYYPYSVSANIDAHTFYVLQDQSSETGYKASEFLWGKTLGVAPTPDPVVISTKHIMSCLKIELKAGTGWTAEDINAASVSITGLRTSAKINLADGSVQANGDVADIRPLFLGEGTFKALVVPQSVSDAQLLKIKVGNNDYSFKTSIALASGKMHKCTLVVNRTSEGINIGIDPWEDGVDISGSVE